VLKAKRCRQDGTTQTYSKVNPAPFRMDIKNAHLLEWAPVV